MWLNIFPYVCIYVYEMYRGNVTGVKLYVYMNCTIKEKHVFYVKKPFKENINFIVKSICEILQAEILVINKCKSISSLRIILSRIPRINRVHVVIAYSLYDC